VDKLSQIAGQVERGFTGIGENITSVLIRDTAFLILLIPVLDVLHVICETSFINSGRCHKTETVLGAVTLTALSEATVAVSHKLVGTGTRDTLDFECEVDMLEDTVVSVAVQVLHKSERVLRVTVVANAGNLSNGLNGVWGSLDKSNFHWIFPPSFFC
jgi:hypothetical protein